MAIEHIKRRYFQGKVVAYMKKNETILRYKLLKIEKRYLTPTFRVKPNYPTTDPKILNQEMDNLEEKVDGIISRILYKDPSARITSKTIDNTLLLQNLPSDDSVDRIVLESNGIRGYKKG
jgi:hypothetical protein